MRFLFLVALIFFVACEAQPEAGDMSEAADATVATEASQMPAPEGESPYDVFGEMITEDDAVPVEQVMADRDAYIGKSLKIEGTVAEVCQMKGCWFTLRTDYGQNVRLQVAKKDDGAYAFTMPKDISGRHIIAEGTLSVETLSADMQRHLAEDAGKAMDMEEPHPAMELQMIAEGVLVERIEG